MDSYLGDRMKENYENRTRFLLPRRTYTIIRLDGKAFHSLTKNCQRPFDRNFMKCMQSTAVKLCKEIQGARFAYIQSDEISVLLTDFEKESTEAWFDGNLQKMCSVAASIASVEFNKHWLTQRTESCIVCSCELLPPLSPPRCEYCIESEEDLFEWEANQNSIPGLFDARVFTIPDPIEVQNCFVWRQQDATRNSISMLAQSHFSHKELHKKSTADMHEMLHSKDINWNDLLIDEKHGAMVVKQEVPDLVDGVKRSRWEVVMPPVFTQQPEFLKNLIPRLIA